LLEREEFETDHDFETTITRATSAACRLIGKSQGMIEGVGVSLPGLVDPSTGRLLYVPYFKWRDLNVGPRIAAATGLDVTIDNDANAAALAELWFGHSEVSEARDFIMVFIAEGVGTGIVFDGQIYRGKSGAAGEFGHMTIGQDAPVACADGSRGCWEAFASERAALARYAKSKRGSTGKINFGQLVERAFEEEKEARAALKETAYYLGLGIANLIQGLSPDAVIVGGPIVRAWPLIVNDIKASARESICRGVPPAHIIASTLGAEPTLMGALSLVLTAKFTPVAL